MSLKELKQYLRVDYTDDDSMIELMHDAVIDEMKELIPSFDPEKPTNRQKILICSYVKELYDHRDGVRSETFTGRNYMKHWMSDWKMQSYLK